MTPSVALAVNTAPPSTAPASTTSPPSGSPSNNSGDFTRPLREARQQQAASSGSPPASTSPAPKGKAAWSPHASNDQGKDDGKKTQSQPSDATTAMLTLLGQSVPALTTPTSTPATPAGSGTADAAAATGGTAAGVLAATMPGPIHGMMPSGPAVAAGQSASDDAGDDLSALGGVNDNALATAAGAGDTGDDIITALATAVAASAKADPSSQAISTPATQNDRDNPLDALRALMAAQSMPQPVDAQAAAPAHALSLNAAVGSPSFGQELGQQVAWLGGQDIKQARIRLNPEELGPLDVKVSVLHDHVDVSFIVQHPQAVHAVQQTLSQLDAMLAHHGLTLGQAQVGQGGAGSQSGQGASSGSATNDEAESADGGAVASVGSTVMSAVGLLDTFA